MTIFSWLKNILRPSPVPAVTLCSVPDQDSLRIEKPLDRSAWCVVANVLMERGHGPGGAEKRTGTKHFAPGAKVFVYYFYWGTGGERVTVIGRHRKSRRFIRLTMPAKHLANWRAEPVYSPYVIRQICEFGEFAGLPADSEKARLRAEEIAASYIKQGAASQLFTTRPSANG